MHRRWRRKTRCSACMDLWSVKKSVKNWQTYNFFRRSLKDKVDAYISKFCSASGMKIYYVNLDHKPLFLHWKHFHKFCDRLSTLCCAHPVTGWCFSKFFERMILCNSLLWSCEMTGKSGLTYQEATDSERAARKTLSAVPKEVSQNWYRWSKIYPQVTCLPSCSMRLGSDF